MQRDSRAMAEKSSRNKISMLWVSVNIVRVEGYDKICGGGGTGGAERGVGGLKKWLKI